MAPIKFEIKPIGSIEFVSEYMVLMKGNAFKELSLYSI